MHGTDEMGDCVEHHKGISTKNEVAVGQNPVEAVLRRSHVVTTMSR